MTGKVQDQLNRSMPAAKHGALGDVLADLITRVNAQETQLAAITAKYNTMLAKLDADGGVTDTNYVATDAAPAYAAVTVLDLESRA